VNYLAIPPEAESLSPITLVVLHGYGTDENDLIPIAKSLDDRFRIISLQGPVDVNFGGHAWYHLVQLESGLMPDDISRHESEEAIVTRLAGIITKEGGDPKNVMFLGFSQGAAVIYSLLTTYNLAQYGLQCRGAICMSGYIPRDVVQAVADKDFGGLPMFISHGEFDDLIPAKALDEATELFTKANAIVTSKIYPVGHGVLPETMEDIKDWLAGLTHPL
jgi:phospholipase/carboxylesterase